MSGPRAIGELLEVWLRGLPSPESRALSELAIALQFAKAKAQELPPEIDRTCRERISIKLEEAEHWNLSALRAAVDRHDQAEEGRAPPEALP